MGSNAKLCPEEVSLAGSEVALTEQGGAGAGAGAEAEAGAGSART